MRTEVRTRLAGTRDRRTFAELDPEAATDLQRREIIDTAIAARRCWAAEGYGRVIGYGILSKDFFHRDFIDLVYVTEDARRTGAGSALLSAIEHAVHHDRVFTSTNESNEPMRALLKKQGYAPSGRIENLDAHDPELVFVKFLESANAVSAK